MSGEFQFFPALPSATEAALRASIQRWGVLVPVAKDQHGRIMDGHHRARIADELGVDYMVLVHRVGSDEEARELAITLNADRRQLDPEQRKEVAADLRSEGHSFPAIADALKVDPKTVRNDLSGWDHSQPETVVGKDGKKYPAKRRPPTVLAKNEREAERAQTALAELDNAPAKPLDLKRAERLVREQRSDHRRAETIAAKSTVGDVEIRHGDFREVLDDLAGQVDAIITDPPYPADYWRDPYSDSNLYVPLGELAVDILKPDGVLAVMIGTRLEMMDHVDAQIGQAVRRRWRGVYLTSGPRWRDQIERVATGYKPILIYSHPDAPKELPWILDDVFSSASVDKAHHHWGQSETGMASIVERLTEPGALVVDPFLGGGTAAVVCRDLGRRFIGCDVDAAAVSTTRERVA